MAFAVSGGVFFLSALNLSADPAASENIREHHFRDGAAIRVHTTSAILKKAGEDRRFPARVLRAAVSGYTTITQTAGFSSEGYSFAKPDKNYAADPDRTIDIYLGLSDANGEGEENLHFGFGAAAFKDAPCFDTLKISPKEYQALIFLPANYKEFIHKWEKINPSSLGPRDVNVDLKGTLIHELLHAVIFYYNRNLGKEPEAAGPGAKVDWYVEGLARYFETLAGARHDFFSQGFKQKLPGKIRFSRGGSNYFMRYPDQGFSDLRYENALFWKFIHVRFGMQVIERLSRDLRGRGSEDWADALEGALGISIDKLLAEFAVADLLKDFVAEEESAFLKEIARTRLSYRAGAFYLLDGQDRERVLGPTCATDWVGRWDQVKVSHGTAPAAGDNTEKSDVSGWATDFYEIDFKELKGRLPWIGLKAQGAGRTPLLQVMIVYKNGTFAVHQARAAVGVELERTVQVDSMESSQVEKIYLMVTNPNAFTPVDYQILSRA